MMLVGGIANTFPVFLPPLLDEFGGSRAAAASAVSIFWLGGAVFGPIAGRWIDRVDPRLVIGAGLASAAVGTATAAIAPSLGAFAVLLGVAGGIGAGLTGFVPQAAVIAETYRARRGFATGIAFSGSMVGYALAQPAHWTIEAVGWRWTLAGWSIPPFAGYLLTLHHSLYFPVRGFTASEAATLLLVGGILSTIGRALAGLVSDRIGAAATGVGSWILSLTGALALVAFEVWRAPWLVYGYLVFVFLPMGSRATIVSLLALRIAPPGRYGSIFGLLAIGNSLGSALGPFLSGTIYDVTGSYLAIFVTATSVIVAATVSLVVFLRTAPRSAG
ncbi:MAG: MFS transporter [Candidatus Rokubacteria bacterium]|nr:MFS transporter [Candidatus Rokubacteria bacterium]